MFIIGAVPIGILVGYLRRGRVAHLVSLRLRLLWVIPISLLLQLAIFPFFSERPLFPYATSSLHLLSYALILVFLVLNYRTFPLLIIGMGALLNLLVIAVNAGYIPSAPTALARAGSEDVAAYLLKEGTYGNVILMSEGTRLNFLGDLLYLPRWVPFATAFSVGDLIVALGLIWLIAWGMGQRPVNNVPPGDTRNTTEPRVRDDHRGESRERIPLNRDEWKDSNG